MKSDLEKIRANVPDFTIGEIACSLNENASKVQVADVRFALWLLAYRAAFSGQTGPFGVSAESLDAEDKSAAVTVRITGKVQKKIPFVEQYLSDILKMVAQNVRFEESADQTVWTLVFILCSE